MECGPQRVFKVVFLGNSGVGKSSFIQHYSSGLFPNNMASTVGETLDSHSDLPVTHLWAESCDLSCLIDRDGFPGQECDAGLNTRRSAAVGHSGTGKVKNIENYET